MDKATEETPDTCGLKFEFRPWGKLRRDQCGAVTSIHPLTDHLIDVAACFVAMTNCDAIRRAMSDAAGRTIIQPDVDRLAVLAMLHDIGKSCSGFQAKYFLPNTKELLGWPLPTGHGAEGWSLFAGNGTIPNEAELFKGLPLDEMNSWGDSVLELLHASISHHGRPVGDLPNSSPKNWQPVHSAGILVYDPAATVAEIGLTCRRVYPAAFTEATQTLPDAPAFSHLFAGLVQLADWLGSDTRDGFFPYSQHGEDRTKTAAVRARHAVHAIGLDSGLLRAAVRARPRSFTQAFGVSSPRPMQTAMADLDFGPIVILEAETGSGKSEAALWRFMHLFRSGQVDSLYFALPTRVAASQLYKRICDFVERVWPQDAPVVIRALPGYEAADGETKVRLPEFKVLWSDKPSDASAERRWAAESPKRFLAATIAVGTIDQALLAALPLKHAHLRQAMLSRSLLVVDEVHASDAYMTALLERLLQAHLACGGRAVLLSATLGAVARSRYLNIGVPKNRLPPPSLAQAIAAPYPLISSRPNGLLRADMVEGNPQPKSVRWSLLDDIDHPERIAALAIDAARLGARVLVIRNTVPAAAATLRAVETMQVEQTVDLLFRVNGVSTLHHSRFSRQDRPLLDAAVERQLGKVRIDQGGRIIIGTQTLEQSLDIDADLLITDLCPMDVLLQRLGRLHRHARPAADRPGDVRPAGFEQPRACVLAPAGQDLTPLLKRMQHGLGPLRSQGKVLDGVYLDLRMLEATRRLIAEQPERSIPAENRALVERATHPESLAAISLELGGEWERFGQEVDGSMGAKATLGRLQALEFDKPFGERMFPDDEEKIGTRLGAADRLAIFDSQPIGPFGIPVQQIAIRHHQLPRDLAFEAQPEAVVTLEGEPGFTFRLGAGAYRYSRFGLERLKT